MTVSPFDHPILSGLFGDPEIVALFRAETDLAAMLRFERALAEAEAASGLIPPEAAAAIVAGLADFTPDVAALAGAVARDGVVVPELVRQLRKAVGPDSAKWVHFGATSQDVIDSSLMIRLKAASEILIDRLTALIAALAGLANRDGRRPLMGYTRMQAAIPITAGDRIAAWKGPLERARERLERHRADGFAVQFGGAAGTLEHLGGNGPAVRAALAARLGLADRRQWHSQRDGIADFGGHLSLVTGALGKIGQDVALLAQAGPRSASAAAAALLPCRTSRIPWPRNSWSRSPGTTLPSSPPCTSRWFTSRSVRAPPGCWSGSPCRRWSPPPARPSWRRAAGFGHREPRGRRRLKVAPTNGCGLTLWLCNHAEKFIRFTIDKFVRDTRIFTDRGVDVKMN